MFGKRAVSLVVCVLAACATGSGGSPEVTSDEPAPTARRGGMGPITETDLQDLSVRNGSLFDAVRLLRPGFFASRGAVGGDASQTSVYVSVDGMALAPLSTLNSITASQVSEVRYLSAIDAAQRFGTMSTGGPIILVTLRRR